SSRISLSASWCPSRADCSFWPLASSRLCSSADGSGASKILRAHSTQELKRLGHLLHAVQPIFDADPAAIFVLGQNAKERAIIISECKRLVIQGLPERMRRAPIKQAVVSAKFFLTY